MPGTEQRKENGSTWILYKNLRINQELYEAGITVVAPQQPPQNDTINTFIGSNQFRLATKDLRLGEISEIKKTAKKVLELANQFKQYCGDRLNNEKAIYNSSRRGEVYVPLSLNDEGLGWYFYPWISSPPSSHSTKEKGFSLEGFTTFATAECMLGSSVEGEDKYGGR